MKKVANAKRHMMNTIMEEGQVNNKRKKGRKSSSSSYYPGGRLHWQTFTSICLVTLLVIVTITEQSSAMLFPSSSSSLEPSVFSSEVKGKVNDAGVPLIPSTEGESSESEEHVEIMKEEEEGMGDWGGMRHLKISKRNALTTASCPKGHFQCASDSSLCVPQNSICNGRPDCPDGSDEDNCENIHDKNFWDTFFQKRPGADVGRNDTCKYPIKDNVEQGRTPPHGASPLSKCFCSEEKFFCHNLQNLSLSLIPPNVKFLDLSGSGVDSANFTVHGSRFRQLSTLILSSTNQRKLDASYFQELPVLEVLHLTGNLLDSVPPRVFSGNGKLRKLFLGYNRIATLYPDSFHALEELEELDLRHNKLKSAGMVGTSYFRGLRGLRILHLSFNELEVLTPEYFQGLGNLETLSLSKNKINSVHPTTFGNMTSLAQLYLSHNKISSLNDSMFCNLTSLLSLNLNNNELKRISVNAFDCLSSLRSLLLENNKFGELDDPNQIFEGLTSLEHIYFDHFWMCSWAFHVRSCEPKGDGISSVDNLLEDMVLRICVWIMAIIGIGGNTFVILSRLLVREKNIVHSFLIKNLAVGDLLMGVFLLSIAYHDVAFRGQFLSRQHAWRHSLTCQWSGLLSTLSSEASVLILTLITADRYLSIVKPFIERRSALAPAIITCFFLWIISFVLSYIPLSGWFEGYFGPNKFYTTNGLCLPLNIHNPYDSGWEYSFFLFVIINSVAFSFICFAYWRMLRIIQASTGSIRSTRQKQDGMLTLRFGIVVLTDLFCWAPVIVSKVLAMSGVKIQSEFYAWLAIFVLPVNSALNPILYTLTTKLFKQQISHLSHGIRKRLGMVTEDSSTTSSLFYRNRISRTLNTSLSGSMMQSTKGPSGPGSVIANQQSRNRNRYAVSAINSVIASSTGIHLGSAPSSSSMADPDSCTSNNGVSTLPLQTLEECVEETSGSANPVGIFGEIDSSLHPQPKLRLRRGEDEEEEETTT